MQPSHPIRWLTEFHPLTLFLTIIAIPPFTSLASAEKEKISFNRQIRPILARNCFSCHGPDEETREAELRLDQRKSALENSAISPGKPDESEMIDRIFSNDPDHQMPPPDSGEVLSATEKKLLQTWIQQGAVYERHWAFQKLQQPAPPDTDRQIDGLSLEQDAVKRLKDWPRHSIDRFVLDKLLQSNRQPNPPADRYSLIRRVYLDLIGLPPTPEQADEFAKSQDPHAYEKIVDNLLKSPAYGEHWGRKWLDLARYSDTNGYEKDRTRTIWPYRDWVIRAINEDMPFDQFSIEQLAGDMLPRATQEQKIATGFHRNSMLNEEGGIDPLEYRYYAMVDRVATTGTIWMGLTVGCAQCHSHKYDPISHTDYFRMFALMNNSDEPDLVIHHEQEFDRRQKILDQIQTIQDQLETRIPPLKGKGSLEQLREAALRIHFRRWLKEVESKQILWKSIRPTRFETNLPKLSLQSDDSLFATGDFTKRDVYDLEFRLESDAPVSALRIEVLPDDRLPAGGPGNAYYEGRKGDFFLSELTATIDNRPAPFSRGDQTYGKISIGSGTAVAANVFDGKGSTGWSTSGQEGKRNQLVLQFKEPVPGKLLRIKMVFERHFVASLGRFRVSFTTDNLSEKSLKPFPFPENILRSLAKPPENRSEQEILKLRKQFLLITPLLKSDHDRIRKLQEQLPSQTRTMVMRERDPSHPRPTYRRHRGEFLQTREKVSPQLPSLFPPFKANITPNRLSFAKWLVSRDNPLAARVAVNRSWQAFFGKGLVESPGDFGTQAAPPTHPDLLDWLAAEWMKQGWSRKELHRWIVTSSTYRQSSFAKPAEFKQLPGNELLTRGPRFRLDAETIRDSILKSAGLLSGKMFGPGVYPPQLQQVTALSYGGMKWPTSKGEDRYRRSVYTFRKRTAPFAAFQVFDGPSGENCVVRRNRSNTPLQALTLLNDAMYMEMASALSQLALKESESDLQTAQFLFRRLLIRPANEKELKAILDYRKAQEIRFKRGELDHRVIGGTKLSPKEASWFLVARSLMNLDEVVVKP